MEVPEIFLKPYELNYVEKKWFDVYLKLRADEYSSKLKFCITIPPPNITGSLHIGHALNATLQDIIIRFKKLCGFEVLWLPGMDHAGIATQHVVTKEIERAGGKATREEFFKFVEKWKDKSRDEIRVQLRRLGALLDWSRERFTLDKGYTRAVRHAFVKLYRAGLIYRGKYIVNWCPKCFTALSDLEVEMRDEKGKLYFIKYPVVDSPSAIPVATTRPETMLGDTAVAVNPNDERYYKYTGGKVIVPIAQRVVPVIADEHVRMDFGTGALKITPFHDFADFEIAQRHNLEGIKVIDEKAKMIFDPPYGGLTRYEAREKIIGDLKDQGLLIKIEDYEHKIGRCYRCSTVVEPLVSEQWFLNVKEMAKEAKRAVEDGRTVFIPEMWRNIYFAWLDDVRDWCISRQIWWGHKIPVFKCTECGFEDAEEEDIESCPKCGSKIKWDEDVLDTWFSSALWPFATLGWPDNTEDLKAFYPTSLLVTGFDIIFFWVARMMMMGLYFMGDVPFKEVYIHALVRDEKGRKMSKTRGNIIEPEYLMEKYGADATRFTLAALSAQGRDITLSEKVIEGYKHFVNKIWNASRFVLSNISSREKPMPVTLPQKWILTRLSETSERVKRALQEYKFNIAASSIYDFFWGDFCDWYIEISKVEISGRYAKEARKILRFVLENSLKILHPFMPFVTEEIWSHLCGEELLCFSEFPRLKEKWAESQNMGTLKDMVVSLRSLKSDCGVKGKVKAKISCGDEFELVSVVKDNLSWMNKLAGCDIEVELGEAQEKGYVGTLIHGALVSILAEGVDLRSQIERLSGELEEAMKEKIKLEGKLENAEFLEKALPDAVEKARKRSEEIDEKIVGLKRRLNELKKTL